MSDGQTWAAGMIESNKNRGRLCGDCEELIEKQRMDIYPPHLSY